MKLQTVAALALSVVSSVSLVIVNKYLMSTLMFPYVTTLTACHLFVTGLGLHFAAKCMRVFEPKSMDVKPLLQFALLNGISLGFLNLSLAFNSVGFYQMTKLAIIPFTVAVQQLFYGKVFTLGVKITLGILLLGVAVATVNDVQLNFLGTVVSAGAIVSTCLAQIWTGTMQKTHGMSSTQLLHAAAPLMGVTLLVVGIPLDGALQEGAATYVITSQALYYVALSCIIAISVNFSTFMVIGLCDAVTYQVLGHLKTVLVLVLGFVVLQNPANSRAIGGILIAMVGMMTYAHEEGKAQAAAAAAAERAAGAEAQPLPAK